MIRHRNLKGLINPLYTRAFASQINAPHGRQIKKIAAYHDGHRLASLQSSSFIQKTFLKTDKELTQK